MRAKGKARYSKRNSKGKGKLILVVVCILVIVITIMAKANQREIVGYTYDSGSTVWEMAERNCPYGMDIRLFVREIEEVNGIENSTVYENHVYKIPVYES